MLPEIEFCAGRLTSKTTDFQSADGGASPTPALHSSPKVAQIRLDEANSLLARYHYLGPVRTATICFGSGEGATVWGVMRSPGWFKKLREAGFNSLELIRMVGIDGHKWATSSLLSHSVRQIFRTSSFDALVTYADRQAKHTGNVYLAANWNRLPQDAQPDGFIWRLDGKIVSRRRFFNEFGTSKIQTVKDKYGGRLTTELDMPKRRFYYLKNRNLEAKFLSASIKKVTWGAARTRIFQETGKVERR